jgi:carboxymethylenebutenolidase
MRYSDRLKMHVETAEKDTVTDAQAAFRYLRALPMTESSALATVGFSMGGRLAGIVASTNPEVFGAVIFYGHIYREPHESVGRTWVLDLVPRLSCPTLFIYGDDDEWNPQNHIEFLRTQIKECSLPSELIVYPGSGHSFFNNEGKTFNPAAADDAWGRVLAFLGNHMPGRIE